jgi:phage terminase large subunit-like protein
VVATDERQAGVVSGAAARMVAVHSELGARVQVYQDRLAVPARGAAFQVLPAVPKGLEGTRPERAILDEFGVMSRDVYEVVSLASGKRGTALILGIGTASGLVGLRACRPARLGRRASRGRDVRVAGILRGRFEDHPSKRLTLI